MGQKNQKRTFFRGLQEITSNVNDDRHEMSDTSLFQDGDLVDILDIDTNGNQLAKPANNLTILAIDPGVAVTLSGPTDLTTPAVGTFFLFNQSLKTGQEAIDRALRKKSTASDIDCPQTVPIVGEELNTPSGGQTRYEVDDVKRVEVNDKVDILDDAGIVVQDATVLSVDINADDANNLSEIVINKLGDTSSSVNPIILSKDVSVTDCMDRLDARIERIDDPTENEDMEVINGIPEGTLTVWEAAALYIQNSTKPWIDDGRPKLGLAGTRATHVNGAANTENTFTSMILGLLGNEVEVAIISGAGLAVTVTTDFKVTGVAFTNSFYRITVEDNGGAATSQEIADAINADATAKRIVQAQWGGDGTGTAPTFALTPLAGGLDDGTRDYAELEQVFENSIVNTGYKFISFHIRPDEDKRMIEPPQQTEELCIDYRRAMVNIG